MALDILPGNYSDLIISALLQFHHYFQNNWRSSAHIIDTFLPAQNLVKYKIFSAWKKHLQHISKMYS